MAMAADATRVSRPTGRPAAPRAGSWLPAHRETVYVPVRGLGWSRLATCAIALEPIDVVHIDAHADFLDALDGARFTGASQLRRLAELPSVRSTTALGLRNVARGEAEDMRAMGCDGPRRWTSSNAGRLVGGSSRAVARCTCPFLNLVTVPSTCPSSPGRRCPAARAELRQLRSVLAEVCPARDAEAFHIADSTRPSTWSRSTCRARELAHHAPPRRQIFDRRI